MKKSLNEHNLVIEKYSKNNELQVKQLIDLYNEESYLFHLLRDNKTKCAYVGAVTSIHTAHTFEYIRILSF